MSGVRWLRFAALAAMLLATGLSASAQTSAPAPAGERKPMLLPGKKTLYQRVLTRPGAEIKPSPESSEAGKGLPPFTPLFVYNRQMAKDYEWLEIGSASQGQPDGWVRADAAIDWRQTLTVAFTNPAPRQRALLYRTKDALAEILNAENAKAKTEPLLAAALKGEVPEGSPVVSVEPGTYIDFAKNFYLLPILESQEVTPAHGFATRMLKVASVTANAPPPERRAAMASDPSTARAEEMKGFSAAVVFVVDTTLSMGPYIERTRQAIRKISDAIVANPLLKDRVSFGLVAFRNSTKVTPGLEYVTKVFVDLKQGRDIKTFIQQTEAVTATTVSSHSWDEDSFAGIAAALNELEWEQFAARYMVVFTDAGSLRANDPASSTQMDAEQIRRIALDKNVAPFVLHLMTPAGKADHEFAAGQYRAVSDYPNLGSLYYPVRGGAVEDFGTIVDVLVEVFVKQLAGPAEGKIAPTQVAAKPAKLADAARGQAQMVARAMQLAHLGKVRDSAVPDVLQAWIADRDVGQPDLMTLEVRVLMTKNQLNDLQRTLKLIVEAAKTAQISPQDFFNQLLSAAAAMSRDPAKLTSQQTRKLADIGLLGEYLDDLPYRSKIMSIDQDLWQSWSIGEQQAFIDEIEAKIRLYQHYHDDVDRWIVLDGGRVPGDAVYPVPLDALP